MRFLVVLTIWLSFSRIAVAGSSGDWHVDVGKHPILELGGKKIMLTRALKAQMRGADEATFLPVDFEFGPTKHARWLVLRSPSRVDGSAGVCGAGHEDRLLLVEVSGLAAKSTDEFLAQSCLRSISMDVDQLDELVKAFSQDHQNGSLTFQQTLSSEKAAYRRVVKVRVVHERMSVVTDLMHE